MAAGLRPDETGHGLQGELPVEHRPGADGSIHGAGGEERRGELPGEDGVKNFDEKKGFEHIAFYMMIADSMALCIGFALGWLARLVAEAFA